MKHALLAALLALPLTASAQTEQEAKCRVLKDEMESMAQRRIWNEVEARYQKMVAAACPMGVDVYNWGAQAAQSQGNVAEHVGRLKKAKDACVAAGDKCAAATASAFQEAVTTVLYEYGVADFQIDAKVAKSCAKDLAGGVADRPRMLALKGGGVPFQSDQRAALDYAERKLCETGAFRGLLPAGEYELLGQAKTIAPREARPVNPYDELQRKAEERQAPPR